MPQFATVAFPNRLSIDKCKEEHSTKSIASMYSGVRKRMIIYTGIQLPIHENADRGETTNLATPVQ